MKFSGTTRTVVDGPFAETEDAIAWVKRYPYPFPDVVVDIRQIRDGGIDVENS